MTTAALEGASTDEDRTTERLSKVLLVCEIAAQLVAIWVAIDMTLGTEDLRYRLRWHWERWRKDMERRIQRERNVATLLPLVLEEATTIVTGGADG